ncbi:MAG: hypothetical protein A2X56_09245 [Nitrospirae bacterium GWC2_57_13]|nr:MAG: hypothetical protein A2X56_09245 [Nitrospirae bacterium GWC2_57_13]OGW45722.1 MAG: hypothetical protein A2X57_02830 [Nitrospirae bacterium GWD2_57_8]
MFFVTFLARPKKGDPKKGAPAKILYGLLGRPRGISETRPPDSDSPKCFSLGLGRSPKFSHGVRKRPKAQVFPQVLVSRWKWNREYAHTRIHVDREPGKTL